MNKHKLLAIYRTVFDEDVLITEAEDVYEDMKRILSAEDVKTAANAIRWWYGRNDDGDKRALIAAMNIRAEYTGKKEPLPCLCGQIPLVRKTKHSWYIQCPCGLTGKKFRCGDGTKYGVRNRAVSWWNSLMSLKS